MPFGFDPKLLMRWSSMMSRCYDPENASYPGYGGRGIDVCERWHDFRNFAADIGTIPKGMSMDRIDNDAGYSPENVRLATATEQANNTRRNRRYEYDGRWLSISEWARVTGIDAGTIKRRLDAGLG